MTGLDPSSDTHTQFDTADLAHVDRYKLLVGCVVPRPIAWVTTVSREGVANLAPFSFFGVASDSPPVLMFHTNYSDDRPKKDTLRNVESVRDFVVNVASQSFLMEVQMSSWEYAPEVDEATLMDLTTIPSSKVRAPTLREAPASMECELLEIKYFADPPRYSSAIFGRVVSWRVRKDLLEDRRMRFDRLQPLGRLAGNRFVAFGDILDVDPARPIEPRQIVKMSLRDRTPGTRDG